MATHSVESLKAGFGGILTTVAKALILHNNFTLLSAVSLLMEIESYFKIQMRMQAEVSEAGILESNRNT